MADDYKHLKKEEVELVKNVVVEVHELKKEEEAESDEEMIIPEKEKDKDIEEVDDKIKKTLGSLEKLAVADEDEKNRRRTELVLMTLLEAEKLRKTQPSEDAKEDTKSGTEENRNEHTKEDATGSTKDTRDDAKEGTHDTEEDAKKDNLEEIRTGRNENEADEKTLESIRKTIFTAEKKSGNAVELVRATIMEAAKIRKVSEMKNDDEAVETATNKAQMQETKSIKTETISKINEETENKIELVRTILQETKKLEKFEIRDIKKENPEQVEKVTINEDQEKEEVNSLEINQASNFGEEKNTEQIRKVIPKEILAERLKKHDYEEINELKERKSSGAKTVLEPAVKSNLNNPENDTVERKDSIKNSDNTETAQKKKKKKKRDCQII